MGGFSKEVINVRERPLSTDINDLQSLVAREVLDTLRFMMATETSGSPMLTTIQDVVLGGLIVIPSSTSVSISPGAILQDSATVPDTQGPLDSSYRVGVLRSAATVAAPAPVGDTYYLLEAQVSLVTTLTASRDILNSGTGAFQATTVTKRQEYQITFQFKAGTSTAIPAVDAGWLPIAGVFRPGGGGVVNQTDIVDVRPLWITSTVEVQSFGPARVDSYAQRTLGYGTNNVFTVDFNYAGWLGGQRLFAASASPQDLSTATFIEPGTSFATNYLWYYVYLVPARGLLQRGVYLNVDSNCLVVVSRVAPNARGVNNGSITLPTPYNGVTVSAGNALHVGVLFRPNASRFSGSETSRGGEARMNTVNGTNVGIADIVVGTTNPSTFNTDTANGGAEALPFGVDFILRADLVSIGSGNVNASLLAGPAAVITAGDAESTLVYRGNQTSVLGTLGLVNLATRYARGSFSLNVNAADTGADITFYLTGWRF